MLVKLILLKLILTMLLLWWHSSSRLNTSEIQTTQRDIKGSLWHGANAFPTLLFLQCLLGLFWAADCLLSRPRAFFSSWCVLLHDLWRGNFYSLLMIHMHPHLFVECLLTILMPFLPQDVWRTHYIHSDTLNCLMDERITMHNPPRKPA